ncbi:MAG TPA: hypothetical protein VGR94_09680 [Candidatus Acidoferrales bacterium]|nr:hypothetical protein [Candidatus Acidoferrales bacterium]
MSLSDEIRIGGDTTEFVSIRRLSRNDPEEWFQTEIEVQCDGWRGKARASFMRGELTHFAEEIEVLHRKLRGEAILHAVEAPLELSLVGDGKGHIEVIGTARNNWSSGTKLEFSLHIDQTFLPGIAERLRAADSK